MRRLRQRVGRRGASLLFFALLDFVYCQGLLFPSREARASSSFDFFADVLPLWVWGAMWGLVGLVCLVFAFRKHDQPAFASAMGLKVLWCGMYVGAQWTGAVERGYIAAAIWLALAALVGLLSSWPEPLPEGRASWTPPSL